jgi:hypothetical protein
MSAQSAAAGANLQAASHVVLLDPPVRPEKHPHYEYYIYLFVQYFKSNDQNPTVNPPFKPLEGAQQKHPRRDPSEPGFVCCGKTDYQ